MNYFFPSKPQVGFQQVLKAGDVTKDVGFGLLTLAAGEKYAAKTGNEEFALVILSGKCRITAGDDVYENLGGRKDVFSGRATTVYVPINSRFEVSETAGQAVQVAVSSVPATRQFAPFVVRPEEVVTNHRGALNWQRDVHDILVDNAEDRVDKIVVGETFACCGQWSSYPSHKHDKLNLPEEMQMDEIYFFKVKPKEGFGIQVMYNDDLSLREAYIIKDGDVAAIPEGYHPVAAAPGFQVYYLWVMAGPYGRKLIPNDDPKLQWISNVVPMLQG